MGVGFNNQYSNDKGTKLAEELGVKPMNYSDCGYCKSRGELKIYVPWDIWTQWQWIMKKMSDKEWGAVYDVKLQKIGVGDDEKELVVAVVTAYRLPKQKVTGTECEFLEDLGGNGIVHSHHNMGAFHSGQDDKQSRNLYDWSIVLSNNGIECSKRDKLPCGGFGYIKAAVFLLGCPEIDLSKIEEKTYGYTAPSAAGGANGFDDTEGGQQDVFPFSQYDPDTGLLKQGKDCVACGGTGISSQNTQCVACEGTGAANEVDGGNGDGKDAELKESDVMYRCNVCRKFFAKPNVGLCPNCDSPNHRFTTDRELNSIVEDTICKKCPTQDCTGCAINIANF